MATKGNKFLVRPSNKIKINKINTILEEEISNIHKINRREVLKQKAIKTAIYAAGRTTREILVPKIATKPKYAFTQNKIKKRDIHLRNA